MSDTPDEFALEPEPKPGQVPERVITELRGCYAEAADYTAALADAIKAQAEKYKVNPKALRRYIAALEGDKLDEAAKEAEDLEKLIAQHGPPTATIQINDEPPVDVSKALANMEKRLRKSKEPA
jgi:hypothetical protein